MAVRAVLVRDRGVGRALEQAEPELQDEALPAQLESDAKPVVCSSAAEYPAAAAQLAVPEAVQRAGERPADEEQWEPPALVRCPGFSPLACASE